MRTFHPDNARLEEGVALAGAGHWREAADSFVGARIRLSSNIEEFRTIADACGRDESLYDYEWTVAGIEACQKRAAEAAWAYSRLHRYAVMGPERWDKLRPNLPSDWEALDEMRPQDLARWVRAECTWGVARHVLTGALGLAEPGALSTARGQVQQALRRHPNHTGLHVIAAEIEAICGAPQAAAHHARSARRLSPASPEAILAEAVALRATRNPANRSAAEALEREAAGAGIGLRLRHTVRYWEWRRTHEEQAEARTIARLVVIYGLQEFSDAALAQDDWLLGALARYTRDELIEQAVDDLLPDSPPSKRRAAVISIQLLMDGAISSQGSVDLTDVTVSVVLDWLSAQPETKELRDLTGFGSFLLQLARRKQDLQSK